MQSENLWAPWRMEYLRSLGEADESGCCFLCEAAACTAGSEAARQRHVLLRDDRGVLLLNRYPYTNGHLLVGALEHVGDLASMSSEQRAGLIEMSALGQRLLQAAVNPQGFNVGINIGRCAGAGVPGHLHLHVVPRWNGDTNFMPLFGQVRVIPQALEQSYQRMAEVLKRFE